MTENQENLRPKTGKSFGADLDALDLSYGVHNLRHRVE